MNIQETLRTIPKHRPVYPLFYRLNKKKDLDLFSKLLKSKKIRFAIDDFDEQCKELYAIMNPSIALTAEFGNSFIKHQRKINKETARHLRGVWVYYPWLSTIVHILDEQEFYQVRTARNKYLISDDEQSAFYNACIGIGGLSVGSSIILTIVLEGGARHIRLADMDKLSLSNTNRIRTSIADLGSYKVDMTARQIYEINPYAHIEIIREGLTDATYQNFFLGKRRLDVVIDELDNLAVKYQIREWAKKLMIPVVMAADNGDSAVIDVERYDHLKQTPFFHGRMGKVTYRSLAKLNKFGIGKMITKHMGSENVNERMQHSLLEMGKTIVSWPQLGGTAMINGGAVAYAIRRILNNQSIEGNRAIISLDEILDPEYSQSSKVKKRKNAEKFFRKMFGI